MNASNYYTYLPANCQKAIQDFNTCDELHALAITSKDTKAEHEAAIGDTNHFGRSSSCTETHSAARFSVEKSRDLESAFTKIREHYSSQERDLCHVFGNQLRVEAPRMLLKSSMNATALSLTLGWSSFVATSLLSLCIPSITASATTTALSYGCLSGVALGCFGTNARTIYNICANAEERDRVQLTREQEDAIEHFREIVRNSSPGTPIEQIFRDVYSELYVSHPPEAQHMSREYTI